jgi:hypothetical protein
MEATYDHGRKAISKEWQCNDPYTLRPIRSAAWQYLGSPDRAMHDAAHRIFGIPRGIVEAQLRLLSKMLSLPRAA